eukprot:scaffold266_cov383-Pavlova_lutheri.AAC.1
MLVPGLGSIRPRLEASNVYGTLRGISELHSSSKVPALKSAMKLPSRIVRDAPTILCVGLKPKSRVFPTTRSMCFIEVKYEGGNPRTCKAASFLQLSIIPAHGTFSSRPYRVE